MRMALRWAMRDCAPSPPLIPSFAILNNYFFRLSPRRNTQNNDEDEDEDSDEEEEEEDDEDDEEEEPSSVPGQPELSRAERRELKKKQTEAANKADGEGADGDGDEDDLIANPNRITKKLNISDLSAPRELTRRERYVPVHQCSVSSIRSHYAFLFFVCREQKEKKEAKDRYWKVNALVRSISRTRPHTAICVYPPTLALTRLLAAC